MFDWAKLFAAAVGAILTFIGASPGASHPSSSPRTANGGTALVNVETAPSAISGGAKSTAHPANLAPPAPAASPTPTAAPIATALADQQPLKSEAVAIVCIDPITAGSVGLINYGTGVIVNKNGYILTNEHVVAGMNFCYMGRARAVQEYSQTYGTPQTIALYYSLKLVGEGSGVTDPSDTAHQSSFHDFAVLKIDQKMPRSEWQSDNAPPEIRTLSTLFIPWATDAEYAAFSPEGTFPAIAVNFDYAPVRGDLLSMGGYIADSGAPNYTFTSGNLGVFTTTTLGIAMPTGQGFSGSPVVDDNGNLVALNFAMDCGEWQGCYEWDNPGNAGMPSFTYGNQALALTVPFLDQAMKQDLGFSLKDLTMMQ